VKVLKFFPEDLLPMNSEPTLAKKKLIYVRTSVVAMKNVENNSIQKSMKGETDLEISSFHFSKKMI
jgi:hypothetical protein